MDHWICAKEFQNLEPINLFRKEMAEPVPYGHPDSLRNCHILFRKEFTVSGKSPYQLCITADDYYKLYLNGEYVGQGPAPSYPFSHNYNTYDVTRFPVEGINVLAVRGIPV